MNHSDLGGDVGQGGYMSLLQGARPLGSSTPFQYDITMQGVAMQGAGGIDRSWDDIPQSQNVPRPTMSRAAVQHSPRDWLNNITPNPISGEGNAGLGGFHSGWQGNGRESGSASPEIPLPVYSARIQDVLSKGNVLVDFDLFIEETAYHVVRHGDMKSKSEYQDFGRRLLLAYPCLEFPGVTTAWVRLVLF